MLRLEVRLARLHYCLVCGERVGETGVSALDHITQSGCGAEFELVRLMGTDMRGKGNRREELQVEVEGKQAKVGHHNLLSEVLTLTHLLKKPGF